MKPNKTRRIVIISIVVAIVIASIIGGIILMNNNKKSSENVFEEAFHATMEDGQTAAKIPDGMFVHQPVNEQESTTYKYSLDSDTSISFSAYEKRFYISYTKYFDYDTANTDKPAAWYQINFTYDIDTNILTYHKIMYYVASENNHYELFLGKDAADLLLTEHDLSDTEITELQEFTLVTFVDYWLDGNKDRTQFTQGNWGTYITEDITFTNDSE